jgi:predicted RNA-binding protein with PIN domain
MRHYIIDGYNALFAIRQRLKKLNRSREGFIQYIRNSRLGGSPKNKVSIVFDGAIGVSSQQRRSYTPLHVFFSKDRTADDLIVKMVSQEKHPRNVYVITDDRELKEKITNLGSSTVSVHEFFKTDQKKEEKEEDKPEPSSREGKTITEEMKKEWGIKE